jgi:hypothetical protein
MCISWAYVIVVHLLGVYLFRRTSLAGMHLFKCVSLRGTSLKRVYLLSPAVLTPRVAL